MAAQTDLLVGDLDRERALNLLSRAYGEGRLTEFEFEGRQARVFAARTEADLAHALSQLPTPRPVLSARTRLAAQMRARRAALISAIAPKTAAIVAGLALAATGVATGAAESTADWLYPSASERALGTAVDASEEFGNPDPLNGHWLNFWEGDLQIAERPLKATDGPGTLSLVGDSVADRSWTYYCIADEGVTCAALAADRPLGKASAPTQAQAQKAARAEVE